MYQNIPAELRELRQWVNARIVIRDGKPTKVPYDPGDIKVRARVNDARTWGTFDEAVANVDAGFAPMIGFVFTKDDPYCGIDIDKIDSGKRKERSDDIISKAESYTEKSVSGKGYHVIVRAELGLGRRRDGIELYSEKRFFVFTGDVTHDLPIIEAQELINVLASQMNVVHDTSDYELDENGSEPFTDLEILDIAVNARNADKFCKLFSGDWSGWTPNEAGTASSEADLALMSMFTFYTDSNEQCRRLFCISGLMRDKYRERPKLLDDMIKRFRAKQLPPVNIDGLIANAKKKAELKVTAASVSEAKEDVPDWLTFPAGLVGEIAEYVYSAADRPNHTIALLTGLAVCAGVMGRAWNVSGTGVNLYLVLIAETGVGKDAMKKCSERLFSEVVNGTPMIPLAESFIGPAKFASGQAFVRTLDEKPCFFTLQGEFGITMKRWCDPRASGDVSAVRQALLDVYMRSGQYDRIRPSVYADKEKDTKTVRAPAVTILGESTGHHFYEALENGTVSEGFLPRFSVIESPMIRPPQNVNAGHAPDGVLVEHLRDVIVQSLTLQQQAIAQDVSYADGAYEMIQTFGEECDAHWHEGNGVGRELWSRAQVKVYRVAAVLAIGCDHLNPVICAQDVAWAIDFVRHEVMAMTTRFAKGDIGDGGENAADKALVSAFEKFLKLDKEKARTYKTGERYIGSGHMPLPFLNCVLRHVGMFKTARIGATQAIKQYLDTCVRGGILTKVGDKDVREKFGTSTDVYVPGPDWPG